MQGHALSVTTCRDALLPGKSAARVVQWLTLIIHLRCPGGGARVIARTRFDSRQYGTDFDTSPCRNLHRRLSSPSPLTLGVEFDEALPVTDRAATGPCGHSGS